MTQTIGGVIYADRQRPYIVRMAYNANSDLEYVGESLSGNNTSAATWKIMKLSYSSGKLISVLFADKGNYSQIWDNRESLSYS